MDDAVLLDFLRRKHRALGKQVIELWRLGHAGADIAHRLKISIGTFNGLRYRLGLSRDRREPLQLQLARAQLRQKRASQQQATRNRSRRKYTPIHNRAYIVTGGHAWEDRVTEPWAVRKARLAAERAAARGTSADQTYQNEKLDRQ